MFEAAIHKKTEAALNRLQDKHANLKDQLNKAYAYAVFPMVGRAGVVIGGTYGHGEVFEQGHPVGFATMGQMTVGVQVGGQTFSEILFFKNKESFDNFKERGKLGFTVNASAVIVKAAATATNNVSDVQAKAYSSGGMLLEVSMGGSMIQFVPPLKNADGATSNQKLSTDKKQQSETKEKSPEKNSINNNNQGSNESHSNVTKEKSDPEHGNWITNHLHAVPVLNKIMPHKKNSKNPLQGVINKGADLVSGAKTELTTNKLLQKEVIASLVWIKQKYPKLKDAIDNAYGYAVFPSVGRASLVLGGAYGKGEVYEHNKLVGYAGIVQLTIGVQIGGETLTAVVLFDDKAGLDRFKAGKIAFTANVAAVIIKAGAEATTKYQADKVYMFSEGGLLIEAAIGGQKFIYRDAVLTHNQKISLN